jgi:hypothetical protein
MVQKIGVKENNNQNYVSWLTRPLMVGELSEDGNWAWDGSKWVPSEGFEQDTTSKPLTITDDQEVLGTQNNINVVRVVLVLFFKILIFTPTSFVILLGLDVAIGPMDFALVYTYIFVIGLLAIIIQSVYHPLKDLRKISLIKSGDLEFASKNYKAALDFYKKGRDLEKISLCVEQIEKTQGTVKRIEINENESSQPANLQVQDSMVTGEINYIVNESSSEVALQSQIDADDESKDFNPLPFILLGLLTSAIITAAFRDWLIG